MHRAGGTTPAAGVAAADILVIFGLAGAFVRTRGSAQAMDLDVRSPA